MSHRIDFFLANEDASELLQAVDGCYPIQFVETGLFDELPRITNDLKEVITTENSSFLIMPFGGSLTPRKVHQRRGGIKYAVDQIDNPDSVVLRLGGIRDMSMILSGQLGYTKETPISIELFKKFCKEIRKISEKIKSYYVGEKAVTLLDHGWRLTANPKSSGDYDLTR